MKQYYTYAYLREDGTPYYIGKGIGRRIDSPNRIFTPPSKERRVFLKENLSEDEAFKHEIEMIKFYGRKDLGTGILHNQTDGGDGGGPMKGHKHSSATIEKMRETHKGKVISQEQRDHLSKLYKGKPKSKEMKKNLSEATKLWWKKRKEVQNCGG